jgi:hypothetical protein
MCYRKFHGKNRYEKTQSSGITAAGEMKRACAMLLSMAAVMRRKAGVHSGTPARSKKDLKKKAISHLRML